MCMCAPMWLCCAQFCTCLCAPFARALLTDCQQSSAPTFLQFPCFPVSHAYLNFLPCQFFPLVLLPTCFPPEPAGAPAKGGAGAVRPKTLQFYFLQFVSDLTPIHRLAHQQGPQRRVEQALSGPKAWRCWVWMYVRSGEMMRCVCTATCTLHCRFCLKHEFPQCMLQH